MISEGHHTWPWASWSLVFLLLLVWLSLKLRGWVVKAGCHRPGTLFLFSPSEAAPGSEICSQLGSVVATQLAQALRRYKACTLKKWNNIGFFSISEWLSLDSVCHRGRISAGYAWHPHRPRVGICEERDWEMKLGLVTS